MPLSGPLISIFVCTIQGPGSDVHIHRNGHVLYTCSGRTVNKKLLPITETSPLVRHTSTFKNSFHHYRMLLKVLSTPFLFALGNERTLAVKCKVLLRDLQVTSVLSFPNANKKVYFNPYFYAKATNNFLKSKKSMPIFLSHDRCLSLENICHGFLMLHRRQMSLESKYLCLQYE